MGIDDELADYEPDDMGHFPDEPEEWYEECDHCGDNALEGEAWQCKCNGDRIFCGEQCFDKWHTIQRRTCETLSIQGS